MLSMEYWRVCMRLCGRTFFLPSVSSPPLQSLSHTLEQCWALFEGQLQKWLEKPIQHKNNGLFAAELKRVQNKKQIVFDSYPISLLCILHAHQRMSPVILRDPAHQTHQLLVFLAVEFQLFSVSAAKWGFRNCVCRQLGQPTPTFLDPLAVALHDVGYNAVGSVALAREDFPALRTGTRPALAFAARAAPVAGNTGLTESVVAGQGNRMLEQVQADGAGEVPAQALRRALGHSRTEFSPQLLLVHFVLCVSIVGHLVCSLWSSVLFFSWSLPCLLSQSSGPVFPVDSETG